MCNISFIRNSAGISSTESAAFKWLLAANSVANSDGTGFFDGEIIHRSIDPAMEYLLAEPQDFSGKQFVIAHTRKISRGEKDLKHTHPFYRGNVILVHNGTMTIKGEKPADYCDSEKFTEFLASSKKEDVVEKLEEAFSKFEYGTYAMLFYISGNTYFLAGKNTVFYFTSGNTLWMNTDKGRLESVRYLMRMYGKECGNLVQIPVGLFYIPEYGVPEYVPGCEKKMFLEEPKTTYSSTTVWSPGTYRSPQADQRPSKVKGIQGEEDLVEFVETLTLSELSTVVKILGESYTKEELYNMLQMHPNTFLNLIKELLLGSKK